MPGTTNSAYAPPAAIDGWRRNALIAAIIGIVLTVVGGLVDRERMFHSYLIGWLWVIALPLGGLALLMLNHVTRGAWGVMIRRILEAATRTLPLMALLFIPIALNPAGNFHWAEPGIMEHDALLAAKEAYLNVPFWLGRAVLYFVIFGIFAFLLNRWSLRQDSEPGIGMSVKMTKLSAPGLLLFGLTLTFASVDWLMSLDAHWFSSIYGIYFLGGGALSAMAFSVVMLRHLGSTPEMSGIYRKSHFHDYGKLLLAFTMLWGYFSVSQLIIIYSGNLPEETPWYLVRSEGMWKPLIFIIAFGQFVLPFLMLLNTRLKRDGSRLALVAGWILFMRLVDLYWQAGPSMHIESFSWMDLAAPLAVMGVWLFIFLGELKKRPLLPKNEPFLQEALHHV